jgi:hypothetical protein
VNGRVIAARALCSVKRHDTLNQQCGEGPQHVGVCFNGKNGSEKRVG